MGGITLPPAPADMLFNLLANSRAEIQQRGDAGIVTALTNAPLIGSVDCCALWASAGAVTGGTIAAATGTLVGVSGKAARSSGTTLTGAAKLSFAVRMESRDADAYKNKTASFQIAVAHDKGSAINYTCIVKKANAADDFSAMTVIATSTVFSVPTATGSILKFNSVAMGDCSNGIEIEVLANCGAVANKNFDFTEWALVNGVVAGNFFGRETTTDFILCQRYLPVSKPAAYLQGFAFSATQASIFYKYVTNSYKVPTGLLYGATFFNQSTLLNKTNLSANGALISAIAYNQNTGVGGIDSAAFDVTVAPGVILQGEPVFLICDTLLLTGAELF